jgi:Glycosyl transferases group 1
MRIDLVLPAGRHSWNLGEGWVRTLARLGWLGRVFHAERRRTKEVLEYLRKPESDLVLVMGGDHHLHFLHDTEAKRDRWRSSPVPTLAICFESILDSRFPDSLEKSRSALAAFSHFAVCDEKDEAFYADGGAPVTWMAQCADPLAFAPGPDQRKPLVFFRGKSDTSLHYDQRSVLLERLKREASFAFMDREVDDEALMAAYRSHAGAVNLPGVFGGYNVRTFEALASGCVLLQCSVPERPRNQALFTDRHLLLYDASDAEGLARMVREVGSDPAAFAAIAAEGREAFLAGHTIEHRIDQLVRFLDGSWKNGRKLHIGCGSVVLPGFVNVDNRGADRRVVVQDAARLQDLPDGQADLAYACHILEHFPESQTVDVLRRWRSKLRPGARLYVSVPDARILSVFYVLGRRLDKILPPLFGGQEHGGNFHFTAFDFRTLRVRLRDAGFSDIRIFDPARLPFTGFDCSRWPLSLNVVAENPGRPAASAGPGPLWTRLASWGLALKRYWKGLFSLSRP